MQDAIVSDNTKMERELEKQIGNSSPIVKKSV